MRWRLPGQPKKTAFNLSLGYLNEKGLLRNDNLKRYNARINLDHNITDKLKIGTSIQIYLPRLGQGRAR